MPQPKQYRRIAAALALSVAACGAHAQTKQELSQRILAAQQTSIENIGRTLAAQTSQQVLDLAGQAVQQVAASKQEALGKAMQADVKKFYDEIEPVLTAQAVKIAPSTVGSMLEEKFNEDELKQVLAWIESPTSRKYQQITGDMQQSLTQKLVTDTRGTVEGKLKTLEDGLRKRLEEAGVASAPAPSGDKKPTAANKPPAKKP